jgi:regulatory protein
MEKTITAIKVQKRDKQRVNIYVDGEFTFGVSRIVAAWLQVGQTLTDEKISQLRSEELDEVAYRRALKIISYRNRSVSEVRQHLRKKQIPDEVIDHVVDRLDQNGLLDDNQFANLWVENRNEFRPRSHRMLAIELRKKGIGEDIITQVLENTTADEELAYNAAQKQVRRYRTLDWQDFRRKLGSFLARRGFSYETVNLTVHQIWVENHSDN